MPNYAVAVDIETTGLNPVENIILEIGMIVFDRDTFQEYSEYSAVVVNDIVIEHINHLESMAEWVNNNFSEAIKQGVDGARFVYDMHTKNGLIPHIRHWYEQGYRNSLSQIEEDLVKWLGEYNIGNGHTSCPAVGSSVHFDRKFIDLKMPRLGGKSLHYRNVDISTIKTLVDWWTPEVKSLRSTETHPKRTHRVLDDCRDSLNELKFYKQVLFDEKNVSEAQ